VFRKALLIVVYLFSEGHYTHPGSMIISDADVIILTHSEVNVSKGRAVPTHAYSYSADK